MEKFVEIIVKQLNKPSRWDARVPNPCVDNDHTEYQAALDRTGNPLSPTEREEHAATEMRRLVLTWRHRNGGCGT